ncbi:MAG: hypothetical protein EAX90_13115 [Candidatus Heimdallarchaeota archaeon]|nr:hypothetical protein [Candidatus Heimdallarchaeota archaeon]
MKKRPKQILLIISLIFIFSSSSFTQGITIKNQDYKSNGIDEEDENFVINNPIELKCSYRQIVVHDEFSYIIPEYSPYQVYFLVLNISNPKEPNEIKINSEYSFNNIEKIELYENYLLILNYGIIEICNADNPEMLPCIGKINCSEFGFITDFSVNENTLTILTGNRTDDDQFVHTILTYNLSIIDSPPLIYNYTFTDRNLYLKELADMDRVFLLSEPITLLDNYNLTIINFENKTDPEIIKDIILTQNIKSMYLYNNVIYFTTLRDGLLILDLNATQNLRVIFNYESLEEITIKENIGYLLSGGSIFILNLTALDNIKLIGVYEIKFQGFGSFDDFYVKDNFIYAVRTAEYSDRGIFIIDINNLDSPKKIYPAGFVLNSETKFYLRVIFSGIVMFGIPLALIVSIIIIFIRRKKKKKILQEV